jgi:hypothetical protein
MQLLSKRTANYERNNGFNTYEHDEQKKFIESKLPESETVPAKAK